MSRGPTRLGLGDTYKTRALSYRWVVSSSLNFESATLVVHRRKVSSMIR